MTGSDYIYNDMQNLRINPSAVRYTEVFDAQSGKMQGYIAVLSCDDRGVAMDDWSLTASYWGYVTEKDNIEQLRSIMHRGSSITTLPTA